MITGIKDCLKWIFGLFRIYGEFTRFCEAQKEINLKTDTRDLRFEIIMFINIYPNETMTIMNDYTEYKNKHGNGVVDKLYKDWYDEYVEKPKKGKKK